MNQKKEWDYDLVIVGAGVSGAAQFFASGAYTNLQKVALVEKEGAAGLINSSPVNNSQTLHEGDIETNYNLEKATAVKHKAFFTRSYVENKDIDNLYLKNPKAVFGVGETEYNLLSERFESFKELFPTLQRLERDEFAKIEPKMFEGRDANEKVLGLYNTEGMTVNFGLLAKSLVSDGQKAFTPTDDRRGDIFFNTKVEDVTKEGEGYVIDLGDRKVTARFVSFCTGAHSMYFAKKFGLEMVSQTSLLLVAGNFYHSPKYVQTKVYTVQNPKLPFAAVHVDPDILEDDKNRYGPTTRIVITLERGRLKTIFEYLTTLSPLLGSLLAYVRILFDRDFFFYALRHNVLFSVPVLGNRLFVNEARKIIPTLKYSEMVRAKGQGGVRPQIVKTNEKNPLNLGEAKLRTDTMMFNVTPSPGATTCMYNGLIDVRAITQTLEASFDEEKVANDFGKTID